MYTLDGAHSEELDLESGNTACFGSSNVSIYEIDLQTGEGEVLIFPTEHRQNKHPTQCTPKCDVKAKKGEETARHD